MSIFTFSPPFRCACASNLRHIVAPARTPSCLRSTARSIPARRLHTTGSASTRSIDTSASHIHTPAIDAKRAGRLSSHPDHFCLAGSAAVVPAARTRRAPPFHSQNPITPFASNARRRFSTTPVPLHGDLEEPKPGEGRRVTFVDKQSVPHTFIVADGSNLLDIAQAYDLEMEGACGGSCACSTCHVIVTDTNYSKKPDAPAEGAGTEVNDGDFGPPEPFYDKIPEPSDDENDMLDLAFGLTETSRLGCQIQMCKELDGLTVKLPGMTRNLQASDFGDSGGEKG